MLRTPKAMDETSAVELAKDFIARCYPDVVAESDVQAERIAGPKREEQLRELEAFVQLQGGEIDKLAIQFGLIEDHWLVRFFVKYPEGTAGTIPPTMVRVYESDSRIQLESADGTRGPEGS